MKEATDVELKPASDSAVGPGVEKTPESAPRNRKERTKLIYAQRAQAERDLARQYREAAYAERAAREQAERSKPPVSVPRVLTELEHARQFEDAAHAESERVRALQVGATANAEESSVTSGVTTPVQEPVIAEESNAMGVTARARRTK